MVVHLVYDVERCAVAEKLTHLTMLLPDYLLKSGSDELKVNILRVEYVSNVGPLAIDGS